MKKKQAASCDDAAVYRYLCQTDPEGFEMVSDEEKEAFEEEIGIQAETETALISREDALKMASEYGLKWEVADAIDNQGLSPEEALKEWDL